MPAVWGWAAWKRSRALRSGRPLNGAERELARRVGVRDASDIRVCHVRQAPFPFARLVDAIAARLGLPGTAVDGVTLGQAIFLVEGCESDGLIAHECRHVAQYEATGSLWGFLGTYLRQVARHGYRNAPYERDARDAAARVLAGEDLSSKAQSHTAAPDPARRRTSRAPRP